MASTSGINYRETYFEFPELQKIRGEPTSESLFVLRNELKANAAAAPSQLGGGAHGHLGLILTPVQYALLSPIPFTRPTFPVSLVIPAGTTSIQATSLRDTHAEAVRVFREVTGVEKALIQQLVIAIDGPYLVALRNRHTNSITGPIAVILKHLQENYGKITPQVLQEKDDALMRMSYNPQEPIDVIFNAIEDLNELATIANTPMSESQSMNKAYILLNRTGQFKDSIREWNRLLTHTWLLFTQHFRRAHLELRETTNLSLEAAQQANLVTQVVQGVQNALQPRVEEANAVAVANAVAEFSSAKMLPQLLEQMRQMQTVILTLQSTNNSNQNHQQQPASRGGNKKSKPRVYDRPRTYDKYCWTHGACAHTSATCNNKSSAHQIAATFANKMGGNTTNCPAIVE